MKRQLSDAELAFYEPVVQQMLLAKRGLISRQPCHVCAGRLCNPQNESMLIAAGLLHPSRSRRTLNVFVCDLGGVHICTKYLCQFDEICPISGAKQHDEISWYEGGGPVSIDKWVNDHSGIGPIGQCFEIDWGDDVQPERIIPGPGNIFSCLLTPDWSVQPHTHPIPKLVNRPTSPIRRLFDLDSDAENEVEKPKEHSWNRDLALRRMERGARMLVSRLLFNRNPRKRLNASQSATTDHRAEIVTTNYIKRCAEKRQMPVNAHLKIIYLNSKLLTRESLPLLTYDEDRIQRYVHHILRCWDIVSRFGGSGNRNAGQGTCTIMVIATLYSMQTGLTVGNFNVLPSDPWLAKGLPPIKKLGMYQPSSINYVQAHRKGRRLIEDATLQAIECGETELLEQKKHEEPQPQEADWIPLGTDKSSYSRMKVWF